MAFAQFEMQVVLAEILSRCELGLVDHGEVRPRRRGLVTGPSRPIQMVLKGQRSVKSPSLEAISF